MKAKKRADGEGTIFRRPTGVWVALTPRPERKAFTGHTQAEAIGRRARYLSEHGNLAHASARQNTATYLRLWLSTKRVRPRTFDNYRTLVETHIAPALEPYRLCDLAPMHIQMMLGGIASPWARWQAYGRLKEALALAVKWRVLRSSPIDQVAAVRRPASTVVPLAEPHFYALLKEIKKDRLHALWLVLLTVGCRRGEAIAIPRSSFVGGTVTITRSLQRIRGQLVYAPGKSGKSNRTVPLAPQVSKAISRSLKQQDAQRKKMGRKWQENDLLFCSLIGTPLEPRNVSRRWHRLLKAAGIPAIALKDGTRHTAASMLLRDGADIYAVQALLGHASPAMTVSVYGHLISAPTLTATKMSAVLNRRPKL